MNLQTVRMAKGLSQGELAEQSGVSKRMIQDYEQGYRDINGAKLKTLLQLAITLDCKLVDILDDEESVELLNQAKIK